MYVKIEYLSRDLGRFVSTERPLSIIEQPLFLLDFTFI